MEFDATGLATLASGELIDSFDVLPPCSAKVLPPVQIKVRRNIRWWRGAVLREPSRIGSSDAVIDWFFNTVLTWSRTLGTAFSEQDFLVTDTKDQQYLTLKPLKQYMKNWYDHILLLSDENWLSIISDLASDHTTHDLVDDPNTIDPDYKFLFWLVKEYMGEWQGIMFCVAADTHDFDRDKLPPSMTILKDYAAPVHDVIVERFRQGGKCPCTADRIIDGYGLQVQLYISNMKTLEQEQDHHACTPGACHFNNIDADKYSPNHEDPECNCSSFEGDMNIVAAILRKPDEIPILLFTTEEDGQEGYAVSVSVVSNKDYPHFIAISYVSSHGLANPLSNSLPTCQIAKLAMIARIQERALDANKEQWPEMQHPVRFGVWIDTLMVPLKDEQPELHAEAMRRIQTVYIKATFVIVLDIFIERTALPETTEETLALMVSSPWFSRLWTFSEGSLGRFIWFKFGPDTADYQGLDHFLMEHKVPGLRHMNPVQDLTESWFEVRRTIERLRSLRHYRPRLFQHGEEHVRPFFLDSLISSVRHRQTSRPEDETFCLAMSMGLQGIFVGNSDIEPMQRLYAQLTHVPATLIIFSGDKLSAPGYRWAPRSLLGRREVSRNSRSVDHTVRHHQLGIRVPDSYFMFFLKPVAQSAVLDETDKTKFEWGKSAIKLIFFRLGSKLLYIRVPEDINAINTPAKSYNVPMHEELEYSIAVMARGWPSSGFLPAALLEVYSGGKGKATLSADLGEPVRVDGGARIDVEYERDDSHTMPDGRTMGEARLDFKEGEAKRQIQQHYLTNYREWARLHVLSGKEEAFMRHNFDVEAGFQGVEPWDRDRIVCQAEVVDLKTVDVWIACLSAFLDFSLCLSLQPLFTSLRHLHRLLHSLFPKPAPGTTKESICALGFGPLFADKKQSTAFKSAILQYARITCPDPVSVVQLVRSKAELSSVRQVTLPIRDTGSLPSLLLMQLFGRLTGLQSIELVLQASEIPLFPDAPHETRNEEIARLTMVLRNATRSSLTEAMELSTMTPTSDTVSPVTMGWDLLIERIKSALQPRYQRLATATGWLVMKVGQQSTALDNRIFYPHLHPKTGGIKRSRNFTSVPVFEMKDWTLVGENNGHGFCIRPQDSGLPVQGGTELCFYEDFRQRPVTLHPAEAFEPFMALFRSTMLREPSDEEYIRVCAECGLSKLSSEAAIFNTKQAYRTLNHVTRSQRYQSTLNTDEDYRFFSYGRNPTRQEIHSLTWQESYRFFKTVHGISMRFEDQEKFLGLLFDENKPWPHVTYAAPEGESPAS